MVGVAIDCLASPLAAVRSMFDKACAEGVSLEELSRTDWGVKDLFQKFSSEGAIWKVPDISSMDIGMISSNSLVRFRGMVQDMLDVEYYVGAFNDGSKWLTTKYTDVSSVPVEIQCDKQIWERRIFYCVPVPGENTWVKQAIPFHPRLDTSTYNIGVGLHGEKRLREPFSNIGVDDMDEDSLAVGNFHEGKRMRDSKACTSCNMTSTYQDFDFNMPLGETNLRPCLVKVYDGADAGIKLNDVVDFLGILTHDPELSSPGQIADDDHSNLSRAFLHEDLSVQMPPSKVPRLQCILLKKLSSHSLLSTLPGLEENLIIYRNNPSIAKQNRESLLQALNSVLGGDCLAAEFLLIHLLAKVHTRVDPIAIGKLSLNFTGCNENSRFSQNLAESIASLLPCSHFMPLSLENLNRSLFSPKKDYQTNRLMTGALQLAEGTHLTLDETALQSGQLNATGLQNIQSLKYLMEWQKVEYDFEFHKLEMPTDVPVLVLSNAKSKLFPADVIVPLRHTGNVSKLTHDEMQLNRWRSFLSFMRDAEHIIEPVMQKLLEDDLVAARQEDRSNDADTFHRWLTMARLISLSFGEQKLTIEHWHKVKELERRRIERLRCC